MEIGPVCYVMFLQIDVEIGRLTKKLKIFGDPPTHLSGSLFTNL